MKQTTKNFRAYALRTTESIKETGIDILTTAFPGVHIMVENFHCCWVKNVFSLLAGVSRPLLEEDNYRNVNMNPQEEPLAKA